MKNATPEEILQLLSKALRDSDPEGCDDQWSYEPQAEALLAHPNFIKVAKALTEKSG